MPLVQFKGPTKYAGKCYPQNERVDFTEAIAARLVALRVAELIGGRKGSPGFESMVEAFRSADAKKAPPPSKEASAKADSELAEFRKRQNLGPRTATQF
jgi:hypothetical protein